MWTASGIARVSVTRQLAFRDLDCRSQQTSSTSFVDRDIQQGLCNRSVRKCPNCAEPTSRCHGRICINTPRVPSSLRKSVGSWAISGLLPLRFHKPDAVPLGELSEMIRRAPIEASRFHRRLVAIARLPLFARRLIWNICLSIPRVRREMETYGVSSAARWKAELGTSRTPQPCLLSYGPADVDGNVVVRLTFDHRIFDGALAGRALSRLDQRTRILALKGWLPTCLQGMRLPMIRPWQRAPTRFRSKLTWANLFRGCPRLSQLGNHDDRFSCRSPRARLLCVLGGSSASERALRTFRRGFHSKSCANHSQGRLPG